VKKTLLIILGLSMGINVLAVDLSARIKDCLMSSYRLDQEQSEGILRLFQPWIENQNHHAMLENFIDLSVLNLKNKSVSVLNKQALPSDDAVVAATDYHEVLGENRYVRVLYGDVNPGDQEPMHRHYWPSILVMLDPGSFEIDYADGSREIWHDSAGIFELPPDSQAAAYKNIGAKCRFLRFEFKPAIEYQLLVGQQIAETVDFIVAQRLDAYAKYPYLYQGTATQEQVYLNSFLFESDSAIVVVYDRGIPIGFATGLALVDYEKVFPGSVAKFQAAGLDPAQIYYISEDVVLDGYPKTEITKQLYLMLEKFAQNRGFRSCCFVCEHHVEHPLKPMNYEDPGLFFKSMGYQQTKIETVSDWLTYQVDGSVHNQDHKLTYWLKSF
jgi:hypothetical protein